MPTGVKYSTTVQSNSLQKGNVALGTGNVGPTSTNSFYSLPTPPTGKYIITKVAASGVPNFFSPTSDAELIQLAKNEGATGANTGSAAAVLAWIATQSNLQAANFQYEDIVTNGLVLNLDAGFVGGYPTTGTTWYDLSGNTYNGTLTNGPTFNSANSGSVSLDGIDDYVNIGNQSALQMGTGDFTMCLWVKMNNPPNTYGFPYINVLFNCKNAAAATAGYGITFFYDNYQAGYKNKLLWSTGNNSTAVEILTQNAFPELLGAWGHIVMVRQNGSTNNGCFYVNGVYQAIASSATVLNVNTTTNMTLGNTSDRYGIYWTKGDFAIAQIYNRALTAAEVTQNYNAQKGRFGL